MANKYYASTSVFKKVSGWSDGPCKPTVNSSNTTSAAAQNIANTAVAAIANLAPGESVNIVVQCVEDTRQS